MEPDTNEVKSTYSEARSIVLRSVDELSANGEKMREGREAAMVLKSVEMDLLSSSEKLCNLEVLMMNVATRGSDLEASITVKEEIPTDEAIEFNLLCGILDSEVGELDNYFGSLEKRLAEAHEMHAYTSSDTIEDDFKLVQEKLHESCEQLKYMKLQSANFKKSLPFFKNDKQCYNAEDNHLSESSLCKDDKIHMQTGEQQRHVLRMLEKSLATELELEQRLIDLRQFTEELKLRLHSSNQEASYLEEEVTDIWGKFLEADNAAVVLMGTSEDLLGQLQMLQFNLHCLTQNRDELRSKVEDLTVQLEAKSAAEDNELRLEITSFKETIKDFKLKLSASEHRAETAEAQCKVLEEANIKVDKELNNLEGNCDIEKKYFEKQLKELDHKLQHALATEEASQEKETMFNSTIRDMESLIEDLKSRVSNAECRADSAEAKCLLLSEINIELNEELNLLGSKLETLEASLHEAEQAKLETATKIEMRAKVINNLVMQLAIERDRLLEQLHSLMKENKLLIVRLRTSNKGYLDATDTNSKQNDMGHSRSESASTATNTENDSEEEPMDFPSKTIELNDVTRESPAGNGNSIGDIETVRRIDAGILNIKHVIFALLVAVISAAAYSYPKLSNPS